MPDPRVVGAAPLDPGLKIEHPYRGASFTTLYNELNGFCNAQMRHPETTPALIPQEKGGAEKRGKEFR